MTKIMVFTGDKNTSIAFPELRWTCTKNIWINQQDLYIFDNWTVAELLLYYTAHIKAAMAMQESAISAYLLYKSK